MKYYSAIRGKYLAIYHNIDGPQAHYAKWDESDKDKYYIVSLICGISTIKVVKTESEIVVTRGWWGGWVGIRLLFKATNLQPVVSKP